MSTPSSAPAETNLGSSLALNTNTGSSARAAQPHPLDSSNSVDSLRCAPLPSASCLCCFIHLSGTRHLSLVTSHTARHAGMCMCMSAHQYEYEYE